MTPEYEIKEIDRQQIGDSNKWRITLRPSTNHNIWLTEWIKAVLDEVEKRPGFRGFVKVNFAVDELAEIIYYANL